MQSVSYAPSPVRAEVVTLFPPAALVLADRPLADWLAALAAHFRSFGDERADLVGREIAEMARDARLACSPGETITVEQLEERRPFIQGFRAADVIASPRRGERVERLAVLPDGVEF